jgi:hypothetical protein
MEFARYRATGKEESQMPREIRQIILSKEEFTGAIKSYRRTAQDALPHGDIESYRVTTAGSVQLNMKTYYGGGQQNITIDLSSKHIIEILVRFCIENNIMIPKNSNKSYQVQGDEISLVITMDM